MELYEAIGKRRTIRDFESAVIDDETLGRIIGAALKAPTNDHMRDWHYIAVRDRRVTEELLGIIPDGVTEEYLEELFVDWNLTDRVQQACYRDAVPKQNRMLADAAAIIVPLLKKKTDVMHPKDLSHLNGFASIWCSIENIFLAATAEGYACCLRVAMGDEALHARKVLGFPEDYFMPCFIGIGVPAKDAAIVEQIPVDPAERMHFDRW